MHQVINVENLINFKLMFERLFNDVSLFQFCVSTIENHRLR